MANIFENKDRLVIPNWRSFKKTVLLGELDVPFKFIHKPDVNLSIDNYIEDFNNNLTIAHAGDLLSAALVNGFEKNNNVIDAAKFVLKNRSSASQSLALLAEHISSGKSNIIENHFKPNTVSISENEVYVDKNQIWERIHHLKQIIIEFQFNPIIWVELSRQYSIIGQKKQALNAMKIALQLASDNRFILRSAVRLFAHYDDLELSHDIVRKSKLTNIDPWLTSAEISLATLRERNSRFIKKGFEIISSNNYSPFSFTELASALGTIEIINGNNKRSRDLFNKALLSPNDNSLAQVEWASKIDDKLEINQSQYQVENNFEALALDNFNEKDFHKALNYTYRWFLDMPFTKRPIMLGSHICELINEKEKAREFLNTGLISHPNDPQLLNNLAYSYALDNKVGEALDLLTKVNISQIIEESTRVCLTATRGLIYFRMGIPDAGRKLYLDAINSAKEIKSDYYVWLAVLNFVREELLIKSEFSEALMTRVEQIPDSSEEPSITKLKKEVLELYNKNKI